ncbi:hypothetical protein RA265_29710, partial [Pseudomonas syringae pv. tagetis]|uniref:hypothetical protein n=1 Tax=Pseudomonas syringae group genomosp. 7 TaxID=251699 RepID=UPI00377051C0
YQRASSFLQTTSTSHSAFGHIRNGGKSAYPQRKINSSLAPTNVTESKAIRQLGCFLHGYIDGELPIKLGNLSGLFNG